MYVCDFVCTCSYLCICEHLHILRLCKNICIHVCVFDIYVNLLCQYLYRTMCMNTFVCISTFIYMIMCKCVQIIYTVTFVHSLMYWIFGSFLCICVCLCVYA